MRENSLKLFPGRLRLGIRENFFVLHFFIATQGSGGVTIPGEVPKKRWVVALGAVV